MKKKLLITASLFLLLIGAIIASAPLLIESQRVQEEIVRRIKGCNLADTDVATIRLKWFPLPHVTLEHIEVHHQNFSINTPEAVLYPSWRLLFGISALGRLHVADPVVQVHAIPAADSPPQHFPLDLPGVTVQITNGTLLLPGHQNAIFASRQVRMDTIAATVTLHGSGADFSWHSTADFAQSIKVDGTLGKTWHGTVRGEVTGLIPQKILTDHDDTLLSPLADSSNLSFVLVRDGEGLHIALHGDMPDVALSRGDSRQSFRLGPGSVNLHLGTRDSFSLIIDDLRVVDPRFRIQGEIGRYWPAGAEEAHIKIDLQALDVDLTAVRHKVLTLLGDTFVAGLVCDIVQGGEARSASYFFDAPPSSFEDVTAMTIAVDIARADIHLADIPLDLKDAQGPILIKDGDLTGRDITTWVGDAKGTNGVFLVGLATEKHGLEVDVDIDANLQELPAVLRSIIPDRDVVYELGMVQGRGRANGHLHIGDDLRDFHVVVDVDRYHDAELSYDRLSWHVLPQSGNLQVTGRSVSWQGMTAKMGSHSILETTGHASWDEQGVPLTISSVHGILDANTLLAELRHYPEFAAAFNDVVDAVQGRIEVTGELAGPFFDPAHYTYRFDTNLRGITLTSPALPESVVIDKGQAVVGHQAIDIIAGAGILFDSPFSLSGRLSHDLWQHWGGNLQVSGFLEKKQLAWLAGHDLVPDFIVPRPPYRIPALDIVWQNTFFRLDGRIISADNTASLELAFEVGEDSFSGDFKVEGLTDRATFSLHRQDGLKTLRTGFQGLLSGTTLHTFLVADNADFTTLSGDFKIQKTEEPSTGKALLDFSGSLLGRDLLWQWGKEEKNPFNLSALDIEGQGSLLTIKRLEVAFNDEKLAASGSFATGPGTGHVVLDLTAPPALTTTNIEKFQEGLDTFLQTTLGVDKGEEMLASYEVTGSLNFNLDAFVVPFGAVDNDGPPRHLYRLPFAPLKGSYLFDKDTSTLNLLNSVVCGILVNGQFSWQGTHETRKELSLLPPQEGPLQFKEVLSCFNFDGVIDGPLLISGRVSSDSKGVKQGGIFLSSEKGTIKRFVALAKTLSLINITGLSGSIWKDGFYYKALEVSGNIDENIFTIHKAFIDGDGVNVVATGTIDLSTMEYDLTFFVVPFSTINNLVTMVPLIGRVLGGEQRRIVSVPVKVTGPLDDPTVTVLSPSAISDATAKWILDTISLPFGWMVPSEAK